MAYQRLYNDPPRSTRVPPLPPRPTHQRIAVPAGEARDDSALMVGKLWEAFHA